ncbi:MAG: hypothetical protein ABJJ12_07260 [Marinomonas sp.]
MKIELVIGIIGTFGLALTGMIQAAGCTKVAIAAFIYTVILIVAAVQIDNMPASIRIKKSLAEERYLPLYHQAAGFLLPRARRVFGVAEPTKETHDLLSLWRATWTYKLLDRALLFAVIYPLLVLVVYWGLTGRDGVLGSTVILPAVTPKGKDMRHLA